MNTAYMYKSVENEVELALFNGIWTTVWREHGYELEFSENALERNIIFTEKGEAVGTSELKPYYEDSRSSINEVAPFALHPWVLQAQGKVGESDKIALLSSYRGKGTYTDDVLSSICASAAKFNLTCMVSLLEPVFMRALRILYKVPMQKLGEKTFYKGDYVVPAVMDVGYINEHPEQFTWYKKFATAASTK
ncbi:hypothetical protein J40TS1_41630 [Paenibacillus montaniterrae]|uniref:Uncharacterized protein n=2 Tax=Paenibacillus montaniterrae TaxID=429341 RepID=A0A919YWG1_9BACL|nr:hypothetical protein J40TS1_41630 [Paenibacillus montaniterrae]